ncbi:helix-turn-helix transcriptional regulator [bacterium]|nr:helix-turn-helix transcriptional regulator [bacterium]PIV80749.1 MAG: transcriptional regulator [bacterium CG17_big_fil_post_rev_8_21_14_2_50_64_8]PJA74590.1 MAG: transcriptional regulator [bacterium CG_4_9_14_3_um_filter_65_15]
MAIINENSDEAVLEEVGKRLARYRLNRNLTQAALAREAGISPRTLNRIEHGESVNGSNLIRLLRSLDLLANLEALIPEPAPSPIQQVKMQGKIRKRASGGRANPPAKGEPWSWGDEE